jgi:signal transduction histidine kinase
MAGEMPIQRNLRIVFAALALGFVVLAVLLSQSRMKQIENRAAVLHTEDVLVELGLLRGSAMDGEMACRGYALSGDTRYRDSQASNFAAANRHLENLAGMAHNPRQVGRLTRLREVIHDRSEACASLIGLRDTQGIAAAGRTFTDADAERRTDRLRALLTEMEQEEKSLLLLRDAQLQASDRLLAVSSTVAGVLVLGLLIAAYFLFSQDAKHREVLEQDLRDKNQELQDASRLKSEFLAHMSHELRTPLNAVIGYTGTLLMKLPGPLTADQERQLKTIQTSARHLLSLINDVLDLARIESGKVEIELQAMACREVMEEVLGTLQPLAQAKNLALAAEFPDQAVQVRTDRRALSQILINLASNAIKFTEKGSVKLRLRERDGASGDLAAIDVIDTGVGVKPEEQAQLFRAFQQLQAGKPRREGTGLGLHLSGRLAELIQGRIEFESEYGKGSRFTLLIPKA